MCSFSVIIPLYNKENYIRRTIESVIAQSYQNFEIIVVDDGSSDGSVNEVEKINNSSIRIIRQENSGVSAARNKGIEESKHDYCAFLDADDEWMIDYLSTIHSLIICYPEESAFATSYFIKNGEIKRQRNTYFDSKEICIIKNYFLVRIYGPCPFYTSSICIKKSVFNHIDGFPVGEVMGEDQDLWTRLALKYNIVFFNKEKVLYNLGLPNSACKSNIPDESVVHIRNLKKLLDGGLVKSDFIEDAIKYIEKELLGLSILHIINNDHKKCRSIILGSNLRFYFIKKIVILIVSLLPFTIGRFILKKYRI